MSFCKPYHKINRSPSFFSFSSLYDERQLQFAASSSLDLRFQMKSILQSRNSYNCMHSSPFSGSPLHSKHSNRLKSSIATSLDSESFDSIQLSPCDSLHKVEGDPCLEDGPVVVQDDLNKLIQCIPMSLRNKLLHHPRRSELLEVVLDLGRRPEARFLGDDGGEYLQEEEVTSDDLEAARSFIGDFGGDNRAGVEGTLHRISAMRNRQGKIVGLTCRVGRAVTGHVDMIRDVLHGNHSLLFLGRPGVGKTTVIREMARVLADDFHKRVVIVDTSNEIGGDGDVPHPAIGNARRMQVPEPSLQHRVMIEAVENHMPEVVIVDEIGTEAEALACRTIAERGVRLVATAHGQLLENLIKNPTLCDLVGGIQSVTLGDDEARTRGTQKSVLERKAPPTFPLLVEMRERSLWVTHQTEKSVDALLHGKRPNVEVRSRNENFEIVIDRRPYESNGGQMALEYDSDFHYTQIPFVEEISGKDTNGNLTYSWAEKLGYVPDKDALAEQNLSYVRSNRPWKTNHEDYNDNASGNGNASNGKRGSKRGPRGIRPR